MKKIGFRVKYEISLKEIGYSNIEQEILWEEETEDSFEVALEKSMKQKVVAQDMLAKSSLEAKQLIDDTYTDALRKLEKARETFLEMKKH